MSSRRGTRPAGARISKGETKSRNTHSGSQVHRGRVVGGILIVMASLWLGLLLLHHFGVGIAGLSSLPLPGLASTAPPTDPSVDTTPFPQAHHDLYVFLDANTGKELLAIWL